MPAPAEVKTLVETFRRFLPAYQSGSYKETEVRREFIDPFFAALGWDVSNEAGKDPVMKDVIHEVSLDSDVGRRLPDYSFQLDGKTRFFLEAKKPSVNLNEGVKPAIQIRSYGWSAQLPVGVLTDFEELALYDCRREPLPSDPADLARLKYIRWEEYEDRWDEIELLLSRQAVENGSLETAAPIDKSDFRSVDDAFLAEIDSWRKSLAVDLAKRNPELPARDLNYAVQQIIDRIVFLRICEDRGIEPADQLKEQVESKSQDGTTYRRLLKVFTRADERYNSGLFHFSEEAGRSEAPDTLTPTLDVGNGVLSRIIRRLYFPESAYRFSVFAPDVLGQVYERFLGKVINVSPKRRVSVTEKPEVRKAGGVYYTPSYVVNYLVAGAITPALDSATAERLGGQRKNSSPLTILDPACGSGSFLVSVYGHLLDWYLAHYLQDPDRWSRTRPPRLWHGPAGSWRLTANERQRILTTHIFGVDIDPQAVEVTKLSLLLKVLEGESERTINQNLQLFHERALPDLGRNIKCGNSLIGSDFFQGHLGPVPIDERYRINAFDWDEEYAEILERGGFDVVIGNPPYRRELAYKELLAEIAQTTFGKTFRAPRMDLWYYFVHRGLSLLKDKGRLAFIVNSYWTAGTGSRNLISALETETTLEELFSLGDLPVFADVSGRHMMFRLRKQSRSNRSEPTTVIKIARPRDRAPSAEPFVVGTAPVDAYTKSAGELFHDGALDLLPSSGSVMEKLERHPVLTDIGLVRQGIAENPADVNKKTNEKFGNRWSIGQGVFAITPKELEALDLDQAELRLLHDYHDLSDLDRYWRAPRPSRRLIYSTKETWPRLEEFPKLAAHLEPFREIMEQRRETKNGANSWWHLHWPRKKELWEAPKIMAIQMAARPSFVASTSPTYVPFSVNVFVPTGCKEQLDYFAAVLNSRLAWLWFSHNAKRRGVGLEINGHVLSRFPMRRIDFTDIEDRSHHAEIVDAGAELVALESERREASTDHELKLVERRSISVERSLDEKVYALYALDEDEIDAVDVTIDLDG